jgi:hypothetical protein
MSASTTKAAVNSEPRRPAANPQIAWDDSRMQSTYANVCTVGSTREEIVLLFGVNQAWQNGQAEVRIELLQRLILNPHAARRLLALLGNVVSEHEKRFGPLEAVASPQPSV